MPQRSVTHERFVIDRIYKATPAAVFAAWSRPEAKARWFVGPDNWQQSNHKLDFRVGGTETVSGGPEGGPLHSYRARIEDIVPDERIVLTYDMHMDETRISVSLVTVEMLPKGDDTRLVYTEQIAFLDGHDNLASREGGTRDLLDNLEAALRREHAH
jgi:uncharacterized protein YndB with AHSA1/START domain